MNRITLSIENHLADVGLIGLCVRQLSSLGFDAERCAEMELAVVEAVNNAIKHAYALEEKGTVTVIYTLFEDKVVIEVVDRGRSMPPDFLENYARDFQFDPEDIDNLPESGMGILLIRSCMDDVSYLAGGDGNRWRLTKHRTPTEA